MEAAVRKPVLLAQDTISRAEIDSLRDWLGTYPRLTKGQVTVDLEEKWSRWLGVRHTTFVNSGSSAILLALAALQADGRIAKGSTVVVPAVSWLTDVSSPMNLGFRTVLCDCNMDDLSLDLDALERVIEAERPSAVIVVSVLGLSPDMGRLYRMCRRAGCVLIEDVCESLGTDCHGQPLGTFGDVSVFSTYYGHHISTIEGGMVCTNDTRLHLVVNAMRSHGWTRDWPEHEREAMRARYGVRGFDEAYAFYYPGYNLRATDLQAFLGLSQVDTITARADVRHDNFAEYQRLLGSANGFQGLGPVARRSRTVSSFAYPVLFPTAHARTDCAARLDSIGAECRPLIAGSMARQPFAIDAGLAGEAPNADVVHARGMYLPNHHEVSVADVGRIAEAVLPFLA